ncbi:hypothetical protein C8Q80DRAFT_132706 [Daedaleopsis nitida]|nr:hypothetical protein C8Q80DRAFT_132706 [Daedaleopsis nitida]
MTHPPRRLNVDPRLRMPNPGRGGRMRGWRCARARIGRNLQLPLFHGHRRPRPSGNQVSPADHGCCPPSPSPHLPISNFQGGPSRRSSSRVVCPVVRRSVVTCPSVARTATMLITMDLRAYVGRVQSAARARARRCIHSLGVGVPSPAAAASVARVTDALRDACVTEPSEQCAAAPLRGFIVTDQAGFHASSGGWRPRIARCNATRARFARFVPANYTDSRSATHARHAPLLGRRHAIRVANCEKLRCSGVGKPIQEVRYSSVKYSTAHRSSTHTHVVQGSVGSPRCPRRESIALRHAHDAAGPSLLGRSSVVVAAAATDAMIAWGSVMKAASREAVTHQGYG